MNSLTPNMDEGRPDANQNGLHSNSLTPDGTTRHQPPARPVRPSTRERFEAFHEANPEVLDVLVKLARDVKARGWTKYSVYTLWERARWHYHLEVEDPDGGPKLNNDYRPYYARLILQAAPDLGPDFFDKRKSAADRDAA